MEKQNEIFLNIIDKKVFPYVSIINKDREDNINFTKASNNDNIIAICVLTFDDEIGQIAENIWPEHSLDKATIKQISGLGFPETNNFSDNGEVEYIFKVRESKISLK